MEPCPHCDPQHEPPSRCSWGIRVGNDRDGDGQPTYLIVQPTNGAHVAQEDADWLRRLILAAETHSRKWLIMSWYTVCWIAWGLFFLLVEGKALASRERGATLSAHVWRWFRVRDPRPTKAVVGARVGLGVFLLWLLLHMTMGWFTTSDPVPW